MDETILDRLLRWSVERRDEAAFTFVTGASAPRRTRTFGEVASSARLIAAQLSARMAPGERALIANPTGPEFVEGFLGCLLAKVVAVPSCLPRPGQTARRLARIAADCGASAVLCNASSMAPLREALGESAVQHWMALDGGHAELSGASSSARMSVEQRAAPEDIALIQYTSGSTGSEKGVVLSHGNLMHNERQIEAAFQHSSRTVVIGWLPLFHDMGLIGNVLQPLYLGVRSVLFAPATFLKEPSLWLRLISEYGGTTSGGPNFGYEHCVAHIRDEELSGVDLSSWAVAFNGAEPVREQTLERFAARFERWGMRRTASCPCYGLAECSLLVTVKQPGMALVFDRVDRELLAQSGRAQPVAEGGAVLAGLGKPSGTTQIEIVEPETREPLGSRRVGEIWVSGPSVARGYHGDTAASSATFGACIAQPGDGRPFLRTGDLGYLSEEGELFIVGRSKDLLIVRGRNYFPQDIEASALASHPQLGHTAAAIPLGEAGAVGVLIELAHGVSAQALSAGAGPAIVTAVRERVFAEQDVAVSRVVLVPSGALPRTTSGKLQRSRCAELLARGALPISYEPAALDAAGPGRREARLALDDLVALIAPLLRRPAAQVDPLRSLISQGLDSLGAAVLSKELSDRFEVDCSSEAILQAPSISTLLAACQAGTNAVADSPLALAHEAALRPQQRALCFLQELQPESTAYVTRIALRLRTGVDPGVLARVAGWLVERHPRLGSVVARDNEGRWTFQRTTPGEVVSVIDGSALDAPGVRELVTALAHRPMNLRSGPLFRLELVRISEGDFVLLASAHHVICDLWAGSLVLDELLRAYTGVSRGEAWAPPRTAAAPPRARAPEPAAKASSLAYWRAKLALPPAPLQPFGRADYRGGAGPRGGRELSSLDAALTSALRDRAAELDVTPFVLLFAAYRVFLYRHTGQADILVGTPLSGRRESAEHELVDCLMQTVVLRAPVEGRDPFDRYVQEVKRCLTEAQVHAEVSVEELQRLSGVAPSAGESSLFQTMFALQRPHRLPELAPLIAGASSDTARLHGVPIEPYPLNELDVPFDLALMAIDAGSSWTLCWEFRHEAWDRQAVGELAERFITLLRGVAAQPKQLVCEFNLSEHAAASLEAQGEAASARRATAEMPGIHLQISAHARLTPDRVAIRTGARSLSYAHLEQLAAGCAEALQLEGLELESPVAVAMEPGPEAVVAMLGIWRAGGVYLPIDLSEPPGRVEHILSESGCRLSLVDRRGQQLIGALQSPVRMLTGRDFARVPGATRAVGPSPSTNGEPSAHADRLAYVVYTSGTTGRPKGVMISHGAALTFAAGQRRVLGLDACESVLQLASLRFDASLSDILMSLASGQTLCMVPPELRVPGPELGEYVVGQRVTLMTASASLIARLPRDASASLRAVISTGEVCRADLARDWLEQCRFINGYGPSEAAIGATLAELERTDVEPLAHGSRRVPIGTALPGYRVYVLDRDLNPLPPGVPGELYIAGSGLARGYLRQPVLTAERFVPDPFRAGERMYATGDLGCLGPSGAYEFLGRSDEQAKICGFRVEPQDVAATLRRATPVRDCHVSVNQPPGEPAKLIAHVVWRDRPAWADLREFIRRELPAYLRPAELLDVPELPLGPSGKIDATRLPAAPQAAPSRAPSVGENVAFEAQLLDLWREILGAREVAPGDNFFELGGHSLLLSELREKVSAISGVDIPLVEFFKHPNIRSLASYVAQRSAGVPPAEAERSARSSVWSEDGVAIIGMAARMPGAASAREFFSNLLAGKESVRFFAAGELRAVGVPAELAADQRFVPARALLEGVEAFDAEFFDFSARDAELLDPQNRLLLESAQLAFDDAGYDPLAIGAAGAGCGVFVGSGRSGYLENNLASHPDLLRALGPLKIGIGSDRSFAATLIGYKLNLSGPCLNVDTACSTALVAVHQACLSLLTGGCDLALAGAASIDVPGPGGHLYESGGIGSLDGHCRAFDAAASGTVKGMGGGMLLLKRARDAATDGDHVYAVIRGAAINNDGSNKVGFTAPSPLGQAQVIQGALAAAGFAPSSIDYIEAHGTATPIGDPLEVEALNAVFSGLTPNSIPIGSVKSNIGHLDCAAGLAGMIKGALMLDGAQIPPTLHVAEKSPRIAWAQGPFYPAVARDRLRRKGRSLRLGVSSFGIGGTNAHAVLETAPPPVPRAQSTGAQLIQLSGKSNEAVDQAARELRAHLSAHPELDLADVAFSLSQRRQHEFRRSLVAHSTHELELLLEAESGAAVRSKEAAPRVVLVAADPSGANLATLHALARESRPCAAILARLTGAASEFPAIAERLRHAGSGGPLEDPVLLEEIVELGFGLAIHEFLRHWGIAPTVLGYHQGELLARCAAGSSLEQAVAHAAQRARARREGPTLRLVSVAAPAAEIRADLTAGAALASIDGPAACTVAVPEPELHALRERWGERGLRVELQGRSWLLPGDRTPSGMGAVDLGSALDALDGPQPVALLDLGAGWRVARLWETRSSSKAIRAFAPQRAETIKEAELLQLVGRLWQLGVPFARAASAPRAQRVSLPGYPFQRRRYWIDAVRAPEPPDPGRPTLELAAARSEGAARAESNSAVHQHVLHAFRQLLGATPDGPDADFFELGGDSLSAARMATLLSELTGVPLSARSILENPTVAGIELALSDQRSVAAPGATSPGAENEGEHASSEQLGLWLLQQAEPSSAALNLPAAIAIEGPIDTASLCAALQEVLGQHSVLRHNFWRHGEELRSAPRHAPDALVLRQVDVPRGGWADFATEQSALPFDLASELLVRAWLLRAGPEDALLLLVVHHVVADGPSLLQILGDLTRGYRRRRGGAVAPMAEPRQYSQYVSWQRGLEARGVPAADLSYWQRALAGVKLTTLPYDCALGSGRGATTASASLAISPELATRLKATCRTAQATPFELVLAAFSVLLGIYRGERDLAVVVPASLRSDALLEEVVGPFVNLLVITSRVSPHLPFSDLLQQVKHTLREAKRHSSVAFERVAAAAQLAPGGAGGCRVPIAVAVRGSVEGDVALHGTRATTPFVLDHKASQFDLTLWIEGQGGQMRLALEYREAAYSPGFSAALLQHLHVLLQQCAGGSALSLGQFSLLEPEQRTGLEHWNGTARQVPEERVEQSFWRIAQQMPDVVALSSGHLSLTYGELAARVDRLSAVLQERLSVRSAAGAAQASGVVGIYLDRSPELIVATLAALRAGFAFMPLDPNLPRERLEYMVRAANARAIISRAEGEVLRSSTGVPLVRVDDDFSAARAARVVPASSLDGEAYVLFTSGSTGQPKGVIVGHRALTNQVAWRTRAYGFGRGHRVLQKTPVGFDVAMFELFCSLVAGGTLVIAEPGRQRDPRYCAALVQSRCVNLMHFVPSMLQAYLELGAEAAPASLERVLCSGEALSPALRDRFQEVFAQTETRLANLYGPTEATIDVSSWDASAAPERPTVPIGYPVDNTRLYVLDAFDNLLPIGVPGELAIAGLSLANGYAGRPALTAAAFVPDPFAATPGQRLYRTGDWVYRAPDGSLEFLGRRDAQIKLRGFRIELGEIEAALLDTGWVEDAAVVVQGRTPESQRLVAHIVPRASTDNDPASWKTYSRALRDKLAIRLPEPMLPSLFVPWSELPRGATGKLQRDRLESTREASNEPRAGQRSADALEQRIAAAWQAVLRGEVPELDANFFEHGGNSLSALRLLAGIEREFGTRLELDRLYRDPTVQGLALALRPLIDGASAPGSAVAIDHGSAGRTRPDNGSPFALSELQQAYWIGRSSAFEMGNIATHGYLEIAAAQISVPEFTAALNLLIERHGMLRVVVTEDGMQRILPEVPRYSPVCRVLEGRDSEATTRELQQIRDEMSHTVFDLARWPAFEVRLTQLPEPRGWLIHVSVDAIAIDGPSTLILTRDLNRLYGALRAGRAPATCLEPLQRSYRDYIEERTARRDSAAYSKARAYWAERLADLPDPPRLPQAKALAAVTTPRFTRRKFVLDRTRWSTLKDAARARRTTASVLLLTAYAEVLARWSGSRRFLLNLPITNRDAEPELQSVVGNFTTLVLLDVQLAPGASFAAAAHQIHEQLFRDLEHRDFDGVEVQRLLARRRGSVQEASAPVVFTGMVAHESDDSGEGETLDLRQEEFGITQTPQVVLDYAALERGGELLVTVDCVDEIFCSGVVDGLFEAMRERLTRLAESGDEWDNPAQAPKLTALTHLPDLGEGSTLHGPFERSSARWPERVALIAVDRQLSYRELREHVDAVAARLLDLGVKRGDPVVILMEKGPEQVIAALAILKVGGAYVPVSASMARARRDEYLARVGAQIVLTQSDLPEDPTLAPRHIIALDWSAPPAPASARIWPRVEASDVAYILFTSGTTGVPKGVVIDHRGAVNTIVDINRRLDVGPADRSFVVSAFSFDLSVYDVFGMLAAGGAVVFPDPRAPYDPERWTEILEQAGVTVWNSVPMLMQHLVEHLEQMGAQAPRLCLRSILLSGDWIGLDLPGRVRRFLPDADVFSLGGATEASIWSILYPIGQVDPEWKSIPYGRALTGQEVLVLDGQLAPCPTWVTGDLYIAGVGLAKGYFRDEQETARCFLHHPQSSARLYRTGDLGRLLPDGNIEFLGRSDTQVKVNGYRIELGEIESRLSQHPGVGQAVVLAEREGKEVKRLHGYVTLQEPEPAQEELDPAVTVHTHEVGDRDPAWRSIEALRSELEAGDGRPEQKRLAELEVASLLRRYELELRALFSGWNLFRRPGERTALDEVMRAKRIAPRYRRWLARAFGFLERAGILERSGDGVRTLRSIDSLGGQGTQAGELPLAELLSEAIHSAEIYASEETAGKYQEYFGSCHAVASRALSGWVEARQQPLQILELGAGYGSLTRHVLPLLPSGSRYLFTDVSSFFLDRASSEFASYPFVEMRMFDMDQHPSTQRVEPHQFDLVIAASVLHNARDIRKTLEHVRSMLAPGGLLLLIEETKFYPFFDLGMGLQQGFDGREDEDFRPAHPLLEREQWNALFQELRFATSATLVSSESPADVLGFDVIVAQAPSRALELNCAALAAFLERTLPSYVVPRQYTVLDRMPLGKNGKVDRGALPASAPAAQETIEFVAPRTETEHELAEILRVVLNVPKVGMRDQFLRLGGDSLLAAKVALSIRKKYGINFPIRALFEADVANLAQLIGAARANVDRDASVAVVGEI